jgi:hypothetical protein
MKTYTPVGYPVSTAGLSPTGRCVDLRRRAMTWKRRRYPIDRLPIRKVENLVEALHVPRRGFDSFGSWNGETGDASICVGQIGGGYHRDARLREYQIRGGRVIAIRRVEP